MDLMNIIELQKKRMGVYGGDNENVLNNTIFDNFESNPAYRIVEYKSQKIGIHFLTKTGKNRHSETYIITRPENNFNAGEYVYDEYGNLWMCYGVRDYPIRKHYMDLCNHNLKWIDSSDNLIIKPSIISAQTLYTTGIKDEKVIEIPNGMIGVQIPYDNDTKKLNREASFVFNKTKYKITFYNEAEYEGLIILICTEIGTSHLDDKINEIADRWVQVDGKKIDRLPWLDEQQPPIEPDEPTVPKTGLTYTITAKMPYADVSDNEIWLDDPPAIYTIHKFVDGVEVSGKFTFEVTDMSIITITDTTNNTISIIANDFVGKKNIKLIVTDVDTKQVAIEKEILICGR